MKLKTKLMKSFVGFVTFVGLSAFVTPTTVLADNVSHEYQTNSNETTTLKLTNNTNHVTSESSLLENKRVAYVTRDGLAGSGAPGRAGWGPVIGRAAGGAGIAAGGAIIQKSKKVKSPSKKILKDKNTVDMKKFKGGNSYKKGPNGYSVRKDKSAGKVTAHGGSYWKLYDRNGRVATLNNDGKILRG